MQIDIPLHVLELNSLFDELAPDSRHHRTWHERQEVAQESWEHIRPYIFEEVLKNSMLPCDRVCICIQSFCYIY